MFDRIFANFLVSAGKLSEQNLGAIFSNQERKRVRLGVIAISEKLMTIEQVEEVNQLQAIYDKRFGDIAIDKKYLTEEQVSRLLVLQGNAFLAFVQSVTDAGILTINDIDEALDEYQKANNFTLGNMEDLKSCDIDRIIPIFTYDQPDIIQQLCGVAVRTISRLIDYHVYINFPKTIGSFDYKTLCLQELAGEHKILTSLAGELKGSLRDTAIGFAGSENIEEDEDTLDAVCELINCINGLLSTELSSKNIDVDMDAPEYYGTPGTLKCESLFCLPIIVYGKELDLLVALNKEYTI
ncbi:MAG: hypothetical protein K5662_06445 [Lachnospiraceae bacterium]|nr:hypothetical protein [Lachnospiraceae bacterium]